MPECSVLDLDNRILHVHRDPIQDGEQPFQHGYRRVETITATSHVSPLSKPDARIAVLALLTRARPATQREGATIWFRSRWSLTNMRAWCAHVT